MIQRPGVRARWIRAVALAVLLVFGSLGDSLHRAQVAHRICPEHGEWVDVAAAPHALPAERARAPISTKPVVVPDADQRLDHHDHCLLAAFARMNLATWTVASTPEHVPPPATERAIPRTAFIPSPIPLLLLAPKHSPPLV